MTTIIHTDDADAVTKKAAERLGEGACVAMPTETVYGLAADATNGEAVAKIFEMKGRPSFNPLICHVADFAMARKHGRLNATANSLAEHFWPGPLTLVVPRQPDSDIHELVFAGLDTIGLRMPQGPIRQVSRCMARPLAAPSANRSGRISPTTAKHVAGEYGEADLVVIDGGPCSVGIESTIVRCEEDCIEILRPGGISREALEEASGLPVARGRQDRIEAPGMLASHYAPRSSMMLDVLDCPPAAALMAFGSDVGKDRRAAAIVLNLTEEGDLREAAVNLYNHLKALDSVSASVIAVEPIPMEGLGAAINDRLARAAAPKERYA